MAGYGSFWGGFWGGSGPSLSDLRVVGAVALTPQRVQVEFSQPLATGFPANSDPANYSIPGLFVYGVTLNGNYAILDTSIHNPIFYTVTVGNARAVSGAFLNPIYNWATFFGLAGALEVFAIATGEYRLRIFCPIERLLLNPELLDPASYRLLEDHQIDITIAEVLPEVAGNPFSIVLVPATPLKNTSWYSLYLLSVALRTESGKGVYLGHNVLQWVENVPHTGIPFDRFSGEVTGGLLGQPAGLVYFSPALNTPASGSVIQVDEVSVCTRAYDTYTFPVPVDPAPLYTFSPNLAISHLGLHNVSLWATAFRLGEARMDLSDQPADTVPTAVDGRCVVEVKEPWDQDYVALLNNPAWHLYDGTPKSFICADNLAPIPPGPDTVIVLVP
ncbi:MAG: hypothetical protein WC565_07765 [Parcubacteria group bacterium]